MTTLNKTGVCGAQIGLWCLDTCSWICCGHQCYVGWRQKLTGHYMTTALSASVSTWVMSQPSWTRQCFGRVVPLQEWVGVASWTYFGLLFIREERTNVLASWGALFFYSKCTDERPLWRKTALIRGHSENRPPRWEATLKIDLQDERPLWRKTSKMRGHSKNRPPRWEATLKLDL